MGYMHGVRLVSTPPANTSGTASAGLLERSAVRFEKSTMTEEESSEGERYAW
jgi:hypothetical protein